MSVDRWSFEDQSGVLGVLVHGPAVVARSTGIVAAVRCIFASPGGLEIDLVLRAIGVQAEAAGRQSFGGHVPHMPPAGETIGTWRGGSEPVLLVEVNGRRATAYPSEQGSSGGEDHFDSEMSVAIPELPSDGLIKLSVSWPEAGLAEGSVTLTLGSLDDLENRVVRLLP
jgi:hypothetical protein